jgi:hypothetical protein
MIYDCVRYDTQGNSPAPRLLRISFMDVLNLVDWIGSGAYKGERLHIR